jgi:hypothetical protein
MLLWAKRGPNAALHPLMREKMVKPIIGTRFFFVSKETDEA